MAVKSRRTEINWQDIQGNVLKGYGLPYARYLFLTINAGEKRARDWIESCLPQVTRATLRGSKPVRTLNIALTYGGLQALGIKKSCLDTFPKDFRQGFNERMTSRGPSASLEAPHVVAVVHGDAHGTCEKRAQGLRSSAEAAGIVATKGWEAQDAATLQTDDNEEGKSPPRYEHFGFVDALSQPSIEGARDPVMVRGNGTPDRPDHWKPLRTGEFVLGYPDEESENPPIPKPRELVVNGSYLVYWKIEQEVALFRRMLTEKGNMYPGGEEELAAKLVGRWRDGTPIVVAPEGENRRLARDPTRNNDFSYGQDRLGHRCPIGSHIRRMNPRDALGPSAPVRRHRLLRRGMPYGTPLPEGALVPDGRSRGLIFVGYCASLQRQFEFLVSDWLNDGNAFGLGREPDPIAGTWSGQVRFQVQGPQPWYVTELEPVVRPVQGAYFFQPGLRALGYIARGTVPDPTD